MLFKNLKYFKIFFFVVKFVDPSNSKNFLISCWKTTINAKKPTLMNLPKRLLKTFILSTSVSFQIKYIITIPMKILIATVPLRSLYK